MKAWIITGENKIEQKDMGQQTVSPACVKLKMLSVALGAHEGVLFGEGREIIPGRNGVGLVTEVGSEVTGFKRGDMAYIRPVSACGECSKCRAGKRGECEHSYTYGMTEEGVLRDFIVVPQDDLILLPAKIAPSEGVFIESVALAIAALDALGPEKGEHIVIMGATLVGLLLAQAALYYQAVPILVDMRGDRLELAQKLGIYYTVSAVDSDPVKKIFSITCGKMAETMCYCPLSGLPLQRSFECLARSGRAAIAGFGDIKENMTFNFMPLLERNISLRSVSGGEDNYLSAVNMLASKAISVAPLVSRKLTFDEAGEVISELSDDKTKYISAVVEIDKL